MKSIFLSLIFCLSLNFSLAAQTKETNQLTGEQTGAISEIEKSNADLIKFYNEKNYDEALKRAVKIDGIAEKNGLTKNPKVLPALVNAGDIYSLKQKYSEALAVYQKILAGYLEKPAGANLPAAKITERIADVYFYKQNYDRSEEFYLKAVTLREKLNGTESREIADLNDSLGNLYRKQNNLDKANAAYLKAIEINDKVLNKKEKINRRDISNYNCFLYHRALREDRLKDAAGEIEKFRKSRQSDVSEGSAGKTIDGGIINGKAIKLVKPAYPGNARGAEGFVMVNVVIDESGTVIEAKATCGITEFVKVVEEAALKSKFSPTLLNGQPVNVTGIIIYNFVH